jgi:broad specificity phosphatase PhoE
MEIIFARHGESYANTKHEISNRGLKHPLTQTGRKQASALACRLQPEKITHIYSSPILRAIETTIIVANYLGVEYEIDDALREYDVGYLEGRADEKAWQIWQELFDSWTKERRWEQKVEGGETFYQVKERFVPFIDRLIHNHQETDDKLACIAHGGLYWMMLPLVLANIDTEFIKQRQGFAYTTTVTAELTSDGLVCTKWNDVATGGQSRGNIKAR